MKRLEAQFGDVDLDLELLGIEQNDDENEYEEISGTLDLEDWELVEKAAACDDSGDPVNHSVSPAPRSAPAAKTASEDAAATVADAEAAALLARLGAQFGDLDMSQLGLGVVGGGGGAVGNTDYGTNDGGMVNDESDDESSLEEPTPEELAAWQASQFSRGRERAKQKEEAERQTRESGDGNGTAVSIQQRRRILRDTQQQRAASSSSVLDLLGGDTSVFFGPSTTDALEELVSEATDGDPEVLGVRPWKRLYASYEQGLGFWNLWTALKGYDGPTLLIVRCHPSASKTLAGATREGRTRTTACLGFYTTTPWKESSDLFGGDTADGDKAFLFSIDEGKGEAGTKTEDEGKNNNRKRLVRFFPVEPTSSSAPGYMYCLPPLECKEGFSGKSRTRAVVGLGVGGRPTQPRFHLTETLEDCSCLTYDSGRTTRDGDLFACFDDNNNDDNRNSGTGKTTNRCRPDEGHPFAQTLYRFDATELEVWGIGGTDWIDHALQERERTRQQHILRFQKVDKRMMWEQGVFGSTSIGNDRNTLTNRNGSFGDFDGTVAAPCGLSKANPTG